MSLVPGQRQLGAPARKQCPKCTYQLTPGLVQHWAVPCRVRQTCGQIGFYRHRDTANVLVAVTACTLHSCAPIKWGCLCLDLIHLSSFVLHGFSGIMCPSVGDTTASSHKAWGQVPAPPQATGETREMCCHCDNCPGEGWGHLCPTCTVTTPTVLTECVLLDTSQLFLPSRSWRSFAFLTTEGKTVAEISNTPCWQREITAAGLNVTFLIFYLK